MKLNECKHYIQFTLKYILLQYMNKYYVLILYKKYNKLYFFNIAQIYQDNEHVTIQFEIFSTEFPFILQWQISFIHITNIKIKL